MLASVCIGANDIGRAGTFYDAVLGTLGMVRLVGSDHELGYGTDGARPQIWVLKPFDGGPATRGNGTQIDLAADDEATVAAFHAKILEMGGMDDGAPGPRRYEPGYFGAYGRDPDGNKLHAFVIVTPT